VQGNARKDHHHWSSAAPTALRFPSSRLPRLLVNALTPPLRFQKRSEPSALCVQFSWPYVTVVLLASCSVLL
jgi:hypothetical protein